MKNLITLIIVFFLFASMNTIAQSIQITPYSGYTFRNYVPIERGEAKIGGGHTFGGIMTFSFIPDYDIELMYSRHMTIVSAYSSRLTEDFRSEASYNYILLGGNRTFTIPNTGLKFYGGTLLGAAILTSLDDSFATKTRFAASLGAGMIFLVHENVGIRLGANVKAPIVGSGLNLWWGTGGGPQVGVSSWAPIVQFNLLGGLVFNLPL